MVTGCSCSDIAGAGLMRIVQGPVRTGCLSRKNNGVNGRVSLFAVKQEPFPEKNTATRKKQMSPKILDRFLKKKYRTVPG
jgi:hypothetical protein